MNIDKLPELITRPSISFHSEEIDFNLDNQEKVIDWLIQSSRKENQSIGQVDFILCSDDYLLEINKEHLNHDYYTDIITFPLGADPIEANVFISVDRVMENAQLYKVNLVDELHRVIIHGVLHLFGYKDKTEDEQITMRSKEDYFLAQRSFV